MKSQSMNADACIGHLSMHRTLPDAGKRAFVLWLAAYPTVTVLLAILEPWLAEWPLLARTLVLTAIMVPLLQFVLVPLLLRWFGFRASGGGEP